jgi:hypothetical protein
MQRKKKGVSHGGKRRARNHLEKKGKKGFFWGRMRGAQHKRAG